MITKFALAVAAAVLVLPGLGLADSANWNDEKATQVDQNRNTNSGLGNGGEYKNKITGNWESPPYLGNAELSPLDKDPGHSGNQCQGGKNC
jgi:hypothetical protein